MVHGLFFLHGAQFFCVHCSPVSPEAMDWSPYYPQYFSKDTAQPERQQHLVRFADIGCGYGGLLGEDAGQTGTASLVPGIQSAMWRSVVLCGAMCLHPN